MQTGNSDFYLEAYKQPNYFRYRSWLYDVYVSSLVAFCKLKKGNSVLDVGCGQGFFSYLFYQNGLKVHGIDTSQTGIDTAQRLYGHWGIIFAVADLETATFPEQFDCIFVRSCSLYNTPGFPDEKEVTNKLLKHLKPGGIFIFAYNSNCSSEVKGGWRYHSLEEVERHFHGSPNVKIFFLNKITTHLFRKYSFTRLAKKFNVFLSRAFGTGGEAICVFRKSPL
jgi:SAM-dependent methyltransferase